MDEFEWIVHNKSCYTHFIARTLCTVYTYSTESTARCFCCRCCRRRSIVSLSITNYTHFITSNVKHELFVIRAVRFLLLRVCAYICAANHLWNRNNHNEYTQVSLVRLSQLMLFQSHRVREWSKWNIQNENCVEKERRQVSR